MSKKLFSVFVLLVAMSMLAAACGGTGGTDTDTDSSSGAEETDGGGESEAIACEEGTYKIAYQGPLTGDYAALGENMVRGIDLAVQQVNEGEVDLPSGKSLPEGVELEVAEFDSQGSPDQAPALAQQIAGDETILAVDGPAFSGETNAAGPILDEAGVLFVSPSATGTDLTEQGWTHFFRTVATDAAQGPVAAQFIAEELGATKVAVIDDSSDYGKGLADLVASSLEELGAEVVSRQGVEAGQQDYSAAVGQVAQSGAEAVFFGGYYSEAGLIRKQLAEQGGEDITFVSDDGTYDPAFVETAGEEAAEGSYVTYPGVNPDDADPEFVSGFEELSGEAPGAFSVEAYQNAILIADAIANAGCDREGITEYVRNFEGNVLGKDISFDEKGDIATQAYNVFKVEGGAFQFETEVAAPGGGESSGGEEATEEATE